MGTWVKVTDSVPGGEAIYVNLATALLIRREADYTVIALPLTGGPGSQFPHVGESPEQIPASAVARGEMTGTA